MDLSEILASDAYIQGRRAGKLTLSPSLCPFVDGSPEAAEWFRGWQTSNAEAMRYADAMVKRDQAIPRWERDSLTGARDTFFGRAA